MKYMRKVILNLFKRNLENNENQYSAILNAVFKSRIPKSFRNCPTFSDKDHLEEILNLKILTEEGIYVINVKEYLINSNKRL